jgi:hypothetical protein
MKFSEAKARLKELAQGMTEYKLTILSNAVRLMSEA